MPATITGSQNGTVGLINAGTAQNTTSGTSILFTGIPSGAKRITVMLNAVGTSGSSLPQVQIGSGSLATTGYTSITETSATTASSTTGFVCTYTFANTYTTSGAMQILLLGNNLYVATGIFNASGANNIGYMNGTVTLAGAIDRLALTTVNGTDTFRTGSVNILYE